MKCCLKFSWSNFIFIRFLFKVRSLVKTVANELQSFPFFCCCTETDFIINSSYWHFSMGAISWIAFWLSLVVKEQYVKNFLFQKHPSRGVLKKRYSENTQQIYRRTPMPKCDFNKGAKQPFLNHTFAWMFSCIFSEHLVIIIHMEHLNIFPTSWYEELQKWILSITFLLSFEYGE